MTNELERIGRIVFNAFSLFLLLAGRVGAIRRWMDWWWNKFCNAMFWWKVCSVHFLFLQVKCTVVILSALFVAHWCRRRQSVGRNTLIWDGVQIVVVGFCFSLTFIFTIILFILLFVSVLILLVFIVVIRKVNFCAFENVSIWSGELEW